MWLKWWNTHRFLRKNNRKRKSELEIKAFGIQLIIIILNIAAYLRRSYCSIKLSDGKIHHIHVHFESFKVLKEELTGSEVNTAYKIQCNLHSVKHLASIIIRAHIQTHVKLFSYNNYNFNHLNPPQNIYLVVALNFRSDYRLRTHQWIERGNFDFSDPFSSVYKCHNRPLHVLVTLLIFILITGTFLEYILEG